ncbi:hypothetical protein ACJJTC_018662 [Scirpophaga incertulas]
MPRPARSQQQRRQSDYHDVEEDGGDTNIASSPSRHAPPTPTPITANDIAAMMASLQQSQAENFERLLTRVMECRSPSSQPAPASAAQAPSTSPPAQPLCQHSFEALLRKARDVEEVSGENTNNYVPARVYSRRQRTPLLVSTRAGTTSVAVRPASPPTCSTTPTTEASASATAPSRQHRAPNPLQHRSIIVLIVIKELLVFVYIVSVMDMCVRTAAVDFP